MGIFAIFLGKSEAPVDFGDRHAWKSTNNLKVYIYPDIKRKSIIKLAFNVWSEATDDKFKFVYTDDKYNSDIDVNFSQNYIIRCYDTNAIGCTLVKSYARGGEILHASIQISSSPFMKESSDKVYTVILHEIGHAMGIAKHSQNRNSIMYTYTTDSKKQKIGYEELYRLKKLYKW